MSANFENRTPQDQKLIKVLLSEQPGEMERGWEFVYKTYYPMVLDNIRKNNGTAEDATDIFQDALMILHGNLKNGTFREESSIRTYIFSICKNLWLKELAKRRKQLDTMPEIMTGSQNAVDYLMDVEIITLLMNELKMDCRSILTEYYFNNRSMAELKEIFNVNSIQAAKNKKWRCLGHLTKLVKEKSIVSK